MHRSEEWLILPWAGIYLVFNKYIYMCGCIFQTMEMSFIDDGSRMKDFARPHVGCYCTGTSMVLINHLAM